MTLLLMLLPTFLSYLSHLFAYELPRSNGIYLCITAFFASVLSTCQHLSVPTPLFPQASNGKINNVSIFWLSIVVSGVLIFIKIIFNHFSVHFNAFFGPTSKKSPCPIGKSPGISSMPPSSSKCSINIQIVQASLWSQNLGQLVIVKPQDILIESHFACLSFEWQGAKCQAVMSLSWVFSRWIDAYMSHRNIRLFTKPDRYYILYFNYFKFYFILTAA